ncbi:hypothetical protein PAXRUDRAFT_833799 [Paxillus rubicundulus Ve08.2h10]|uniref:Unplaced genomic scaffold scaffold_1306, whole genome shotgun sequence n=1 Tax=Paxillus rubicundulus Ve08.2h10 TaxID=930991 RepID=A0A0D0CWT4_9AGAM|nr:hypothetical protein PAXRUDRAFT_833799 [Paxillus rubicundulus Ve08.2h10]
MTPTLKQVLDSLAVPPAFSQHKVTTDENVLTQLYTWKSNLQSVLNQLDSFDVSTLALSEQADLVRVLAPLTAVAQWSSPETRLVASALLRTLIPSRQLINHVLKYIVKPLFAPTPHPCLHTYTARILPRPADTQDTYVQQIWKEHPGLDEVVRWAVLNSEPSAYESTWPLLLPPVMSFLDDYQVLFKILGVRLVSNMLTRVPLELLLRTGVDALLFTSLTNSLNHLRDPLTPELIHIAVPTTLQLIDLANPSLFPHVISFHAQSHSNEPGQATELIHTLSPVHSKSLSTRFTRLSTLLSALLGTVIMYTPILLPPSPAPGPGPDPFADPEHVDTNSEKVADTQPPTKQPVNPTLVAAAQTLPAVLSALDIGGSRFLKGIIPVLAEWLALPIFSVTSVASAIGRMPSVGASVAHVAESTGQFEEDTRPSAPELALYFASLSSISVLFCTCTPRIGRWATTLVDALGRCWVGCLDAEGQSGDKRVLKDSLCLLKERLRETAVQLAELYPNVVEVCLRLDLSPTLIFHSP